MHASTVKQPVDDFDALRDNSVSDIKTDKRSRLSIQFKIWHILAAMPILGAIAAWYSMVLGHYEATVTVTDHQVLREDRQKDGMYGFIILQAHSPDDRQFQLPDNDERYPGTSLIVTEKQYAWFRTHYPIGTAFKIQYAPLRLPARRTTSYRNALLNRFKAEGLPLD